MGNDPLNNVDPSGLAGIGLLAGVTAEAGFPYASVGATDTAGSGSFINLNSFSPGFLRTSRGLFTSTGAMTTYGNMGKNTSSIPSTPSDQANGVVGALAGAGAGVFITNASSISDLNGVSRALTLNLPIGSIQLSYGGGTVALAVTAGPGAGASVSSYPTATASATQSVAPVSSPFSQPSPSAGNADLANSPTGQGK